MIQTKEINQIARQNGVRDTQIEKDYILSWLLNGISQHKQLAACIVFKGGTLLKKIYFEDYRFSEDLDFTLLDDKITNDQIFGWFNESFEYVKEDANIPLSIIDNTEHQDGGINFHITYVGPLGGTVGTKKIKVDISRSEALQFNTITKSVIIPYSDLSDHNLLCYSLEEALVEKMRSVMQRMQSRDFYDIWYLITENKMDVDFLINEFIEKCKSKNLNASDFHKKLEERIPQYKTQWQNSLSAQINDLPDFDTVARSVQRELRKLKFPSSS